MLDHVIALARALRNGTGWLRRDNHRSLTCQLESARCSNYFVSRRRLAATTLVKSLSDLCADSTSPTVSPLNSVAASATRSIAPTSAAYAVQFDCWRLARRSVRCR